MNIRRRILPFILPLLAAAAVSSCVYDDIEGPATTPDGSHHPTGKVTVTMRIRTLSDDSRSRTDVDGSLVDGSHYEHQIGSNGNFAIFFNEDSTFYSVNQLLMSEQETPDNKIIETVYKTTLDPADFDNLPKYCLVLLNAPYYYELFMDLTPADKVSTVLNKVWDAKSNPRNAGRTDDGYFVMTNSIYYDADNNLKNVAVLNENMVVDPTDPRSVAKAEILTVYVERLSAKFTLEVQNTPGDDGYLYEVPDAEPLVFFNGFSNGAPQYVSSDWNILLTGWNLNAYETELRLFKKLTKGKDYFPNWSGWRDPASFRTYWAEDAHYTDMCPSQYRRADNVLTTAKIDNYGDRESKGTNVLRNYSFNDLSLGDAKTFDTPLYAPENTYDYQSLYEKLLDRTDLLAGTHVLLGARLMTAGKNGGAIEARDLWRDRNGFYYETELECLQALLHGFNNSLNSQEYMRYEYYQWGVGGAIADVNRAASQYELNGQNLFARTGSFSGTLTYKLYWNGSELNENTIKTLYKKDMMALGTIELGDGRRMPWPKDGTLEIYALQNGTKIPLQVYRLNEANGQYYAVRNLNANDIKSLMFEWMGSVDHFNDGYMYYAVPARIKEGLGYNNKDICGVVRNAWYQYNLLSLSRIGTPVDDLTQPIVPSPASINDQLNITVKIIGWHRFNSWIDKLPS